MRVGSVGWGWIGCFRWGVGLVALLSLMGYWGGLNFFLDLTAHFKVQYLAIAFVSLIFFGLKRQHGWMLLSLGCVVLNLMAIAPWYMSPVTAIAAPGKALRVLSVNVNVDNANDGAIAPLIRQVKPDLVAVVEVDQRWLRALDEVKDILPYSLRSREADTFGVVLYSKVPLQPLTVPIAPELGNYQVAARVMGNGQVFTAIAMHPAAPFLPALADKRNRVLQSVADYIQTLDEPVIAVGDLNVTMWSPFYQKFEQQSGLRNVCRGYGILQTWLTFFPPLALPIDHGLVSSEFQVLDVRTGTSIGSDHLPLILDVSL